MKKLHALPALLIAAGLLSACTPKTAAVSAAQPDKIGSPFGNVSAVQVMPGGVRVKGTADDPHTPKAISVRISVGSTVTTVQAGPEYTATVPVTGTGTHKVCVRLINVGAGKDRDLPCTSVSRSNAPVGTVESITPTAGGVRIRGWALDQDSTAPISVGINVAGKNTIVPANKDRADIAGSYPGYGASHGFDVTLPLGSGTRSVCVYGVNVGPGIDGMLRCTDLYRNNPYGRVESVNPTPGGVRFTGWVVDPDSSKSIEVRATIAGATRSAVAKKARRDVATSYPGAGEAHGFDITVPVAATGLQQFSLTAVNAGPGASTTVQTGTLALGTPRAGVPSACAAASGVVGASSTSAIGTLRVHSCLAPSLQAMIADAKAAGIPLSGWGWRDYTDQMRLRVTNRCPDIWVSSAGACSPPTARPGQSMHERGTAVDLTSNGAILNSRMPAFEWLKANAARYGFFNLPSEPWHWSTNGN